MESVFKLAKGINPKLRLQWLGIWHGRLGPEVVFGCAAEPDQNTECSLPFNVTVLEPGSNHSWQIFAGCQNISILESIYFLYWCHSQFWNKLFFWRCSCINRTWDKFVCLGSCRWKLNLLTLALPFVQMQCFRDVNMYLLLLLLVICCFAKQIQVLGDCFESNIWYM